MKFVIWITGLAFALCQSAEGQAAHESDAFKRAEELALLRNWTAARPFYERAEQEFTGAGDVKNAMFARISRLRGDLSRMPLIDASQQLAALLEDPIVEGDPRVRLRCLAVKGDADLDLDTELALRDWTEAASLAEQLGDKIWANRAKGELGIVAFLSGNTLLAAQNISTALKTAGALGDLGSVVRYKAIIGDGMVQWKKYEQALVYFDGALSVAAANPDMQHPFLAYSGKIDALLGLKRMAEAKQLLDKALAIARAKSSEGYEAELRVKYGLLELNNGNRRGAIEQLNSALALADHANMTRVAAQSALTLARCLREQGNVTAAGMAAKTSVERARVAGDRDLLPVALAETGRIYVALGRYGAADAAFEEGADIANGIITAVPSLVGKAQFIASVNELYIEHIRLHAEHLKNPQEAFAAIEQIRGRSIADSLRSRTASRNPGPARLSAPERRISALQTELLRSRCKADRQRLLASLARAEAELGPMVDALGADTAVRPSAIRLTEVQRSLPQGEAILEYFTPDEAAYCFFISRAHAELVRLPESADSAKRVSAYVAAIRNKTDPASAGRDLYQKLIPSLARGFARLIVIPDESLYELPFETLVDDHGRRLLETTTIWYEPSATVLHLIEARRSRSDSEARLPLLAVSTGADASRAPVEGIARGMFDIQGRELPELPAAGSEVRLIGEIMGRDSVVLTGSAATETALKRQPLDRFRVLHFAVHGISDSGHPERSGLFLAPDAASGEDGIWQAREIVRSHFDADLVTLSACNTARGKVMGADGNASLVNPFLAAGARAVLSTLWESDDCLSRALMREFYSQVVRGIPVAVALRNAKLEIIKRYEKEAPTYLWAGFILTGVNSRIIR